MRLLTLTSILLAVSACGSNPPPQVAVSSTGASVASGLADGEKLGIDIVLHGVWTAHAVSYDGGTTSRPAHEMLARVGAGTVTLSNGNVLRVSHVVGSTNADGVYGHAVFFSNDDCSYAVSNTDTNGQYMLQVFHKGSGGKFFEKLRALIMVD